MIQLTKQRKRRGFTKSQLSYAARVPASTVGQIESGRFVPYGPQLERLARALGFLGDPAELLEPAESAEAVES